MPAYFIVTPLGLLGTYAVWLLTLGAAAWIGWWMRGDLTRACTQPHIPIAQLMEQVGIRDHSRPRPGPRAFTPGRHPVAHLRNPINERTRTMPRLPEEERL